MALAEGRPFAQADLSVSYVECDDEWVMEDPGSGFFGRNRRAEEYSDYTQCSPARFQ